MMDARKGPERRFGCGSFLIGISLAVAFYAAGGLGYAADIIAGLTGIGHAYLWVESSPVGPMALIAGVVVLAILLYVNVPHKWIVEVPFWFVVTAAVLGVIGGALLRVVSLFGR